MENVTIRLHNSLGSEGVHVSFCSLGGNGVLSSTSWNQQMQPLMSKFVGANLKTQTLKSGREYCVSRYHSFGALHTQAVADTSASEEVDELADIDWDNLGFGIQKTDYMYLMKCGQDGEFCEGDLHPFGNIELSPSACVLNYGQGVLEGLKAHRRADGKILLFRPEENALRMTMGAERMCMSAPSVEQFVEAVKQTVMANKCWIPPFGKGSLYIRPLLLGSGAVLGLAPSPEVTFLIYVSPVGNYFKVLKNQRGAKAKGFSDVMYLDAINKKYLEEVSSCNVFVVKGKVISTPALHGTILPGITRKSIMEVARSRGYGVHERLVSVDELMDADEVFCTGTAVVVSPVGSITYLDRRVIYRNGAPGEVSQELYSALTSIQMGLAEDSMGWTMEVK